MAVNPRVVAVTYSFPVTTQTFHYRRLRAMDEMGVLEALWCARDGSGSIEDDNARITARVHRTRRVSIFAATCRHSWRPPVLVSLVRGALIACRNNGEGGRLGFIWQAMNGLALGHAHRNQSRVVFHAMFNEAAGTMAMFASLASGRPWSVEVHAPYSLRSNPELLAYKLDRANLVIAISEYMAGAVREISTPRRLEVVHCGIDLAKFPFRPKQVASANGATVVSVGSLIRKKGHDILIGASSRLAGSNPHRTVIVGEGVNRPELEQLISHTGAPVVLAGQIAPDLAKDHVKDADAFVLACRVTADGDEDGIPVALMEAMALGVPVVSTTVAGIPELLDDGSAGLLCPPDDPGALANCLQSLLTEPGLRSGLIRSARTRVENLFSNERETERLVGLLQELITPRRAIFFSSNPHISVDDASGAGNHIRGVVGGMRDHGIEVTCVMGRLPDSGTHDVETPPRTRGSGSPGLRARIRGTFPTAWTVARSLAIAGREWRTVGRLRREIKTHRPDFVYERMSDWQFTSTAITARRGIPHVVELNAVPGTETVHLPGAVRRLQHWMASIRLRRATILTSVSSPLSRDYADAFRQLPRMIVVPNAAPSVVDHARTPSTGEIGFVFAGSMRDWHRLEMLLAAIVLLPPDVRRRARFHLAGGGPVREDIVDLIATLNLSSEVDAPGQLSQEVLAALYGRCDVGVLPGNAPYQSPTKLLEYAAHGLAVIAPRLAGVEDMFTHDQNALLIEPTAESLAGAIEAMSNDLTRERLAMAARRTASEWTWYRATDTIVGSLFEQV